MAEQLVQVPVMGDSNAVEVIEVLVKAGDTVAVDQSIITLESDKASMEVPCPFAGTVREMRVKKGDSVKEGAPILLLEVEQSAAAAASVSPASPSPQAGAAIGSSIPTVTASVKTEATDASSNLSSSASAFSPHPNPSPAGEGLIGVPHASPSVRRFARELGADIAQIRGNGPKGRILKEDVQAYVKFRLQQPAATTALAAQPSIDFSAFGPVETRSLTRIQKLSAAHLQRAWQTIPHVTHHDEADITDLEAFRLSLKDEATSKGVKLTLLPFIVEAVVATLKAFPQFNASLDGDNLVLKNYYHIGMAVDTEEGLVVPVLRNADGKQIFELAKDIAELGERARKRQLKRTEIEGGCFTLSNLGGVGGRFFTPIINAPEVAILGLCRGRMSLVHDNAVFVPRLLLPLSLSYDHRVIDGAVAARFMNHLKALLGDIRRILL